MWLFTLLSTFSSKISCWPLSTTLFGWVVLLQQNRITVTHAHDGPSFFFVIYTAQFFSIQLKWKFYACSPSFFDISCYNFVWNCESVVEKVLIWKRGIWNMKCAFCSVAYSYFDKLKVQVIIFQSFLVGLHFVALQ